MNNILTVMKKEFARFFGDRRMLIMLLFPGVMIYMMYSFMGSAIQGAFSPDAEYIPAVYVENLPESLTGDAMENWSWANLIEIGSGGAEDAAAAKQKITAKEADLCIVFPSDFDRAVSAYNVEESSARAPEVEVYYNASEVNSAGAYGRVMSLLDEYESSLSNKFDVNRTVTDANLASKEDESAGIFSQMMPMLLMMFLYSGCMGIAPESIAGEKERGTIGALLVSPLKRSHLAIGKILSLCVLALLSGLSSAVGTLLSLPKLAGDSLDAGIYGIKDYILLVLIILSTVLFLITVISVISAYTRTVKEASTAVVPIMVVVMFVGITSMFGNGARTEAVYYLIPLYNSVQSMSGVLSFEYIQPNIILSVVSNLIYAAAGMFVLTKMFNSEKVMFSK